MKNLIFILVLFLTSCSYKDYINLSEKYEYALYNKDKTQFAFFKTVKVSRPAKGLAAFPDGGQSKILYYNVSVYIYDISLNKLKKVHSFSKPYKGQWLDFDADGYLFFGQFIKLHFLSDSLKKYDSEEFNKNTGIFVYNSTTSELKKIVDKAEKIQLSPDNKKLAFDIYNYKKTLLYIMDKDGSNKHELGYGMQPLFSPDGKYMAYYIEEDNALFRLKLYNLKSNTTTAVSTIKNLNRYSIFWINAQSLHFENNGHKILNTETNEVIDTVFIKYPHLPNILGKKEIEAYTKNVDYDDWGFHLQNCCPKKKDEIIEAIVGYEKGNLAYRYALLQGIGEKLSKNDLEQLLKLFEEQENKKKGWDKDRYKRDIKSMKDYLDKLLEKKA